MSTYSGEAYALRKGVQYVKEEMKKLTNIIICVDSLSVLQNIKKILHTGYNDRSLYRAFLEVIHSLATANRNILNLSFFL